MPLLFFLLLFSGFLVSGGTHYIVAQNVGSGNWIGTLQWNVDGTGWADLYNGSPLNNMTPGTVYSTSRTQADGTSHRFQYRFRSVCSGQELLSQVIPGAESGTNYVNLWGSCGNICGTEVTNTWRYQNNTLSTKWIKIVVNGEVYSDPGFEGQFQTFMVSPGQRLTIQTFDILCETSSVVQFIDVFEEYNYGPEGNVTSGYQTNRIQVINNVSNVVGGAETTVTNAAGDVYDVPLYQTTNSPFKGLSYTNGGTLQQQHLVVPLGAVYNAIVSGTRSANDSSIREQELLRQINTSVRGVSNAISNLTFSNDNSAVLTGLSNVVGATLGVSNAVANISAPDMGPLNLSISNLNNSIGSLTNLGDLASLTNLNAGTNTGLVGVTNMALSQIYTQNQSWIEEQGTNLIGGYYDANDFIGRAQVLMPTGLSNNIVTLNNLIPDTLGDEGPEGSPIAPIMFSAGGLSFEFNLDPITSPYTASAVSFIKQVLTWFLAVVYLLAVLNEMRPYILGISAVPQLRVPPISVFGNSISPLIAIPIIGIFGLVYALAISSFVTLFFPIGIQVFADLTAGPFAGATGTTASAVYLLKGIFPVSAALNFLTSFVVFKMTIMKLYIGLAWFMRLIVA